MLKGFSGCEGGLSWSESADGVCKQGIDQNRTGQLRLSSIKVVSLKHCAILVMYKLCTRQSKTVTLVFLKGTIERDGADIRGSGRLFFPLPQWGQLLAALTTSAFLETLYIVFISS